MMDTKNKLLLSLLALLGGLILSGTTFYSLGLWQSQSGLVWPLEGQKRARHPFGANIRIVFLGHP
jgi:hypothetical protein